MTVATPFKPRGRVSRVDACVDIIRSMAPDGDLSFAMAAEEVGARTEQAETEEAVQSAMRLASERLIAAGEPGVRTVRRFGWVRMTDEDLIRHYAAERDRRGRGQFGRMGRAAQAANPEHLTGEARLRRDAHLFAARRVAEIDAGRALRRRPPDPLPPTSSERTA